MSSDDTNALLLARLEEVQARFESANAQLEQTQLALATQQLLQQQQSTLRADRDDGSPPPGDDQHTYGLPTPWAGRERHTIFCNEERGYQLPASMAAILNLTASGCQLDASALRRIQRRYPCPSGSSVGAQQTTPTEILAWAPLQTNAVKAILAELHCSTAPCDWSQRTTIPIAHGLEELLKRIDPEGLKARMPEVLIDCEQWTEIPIDVLAATLHRLHQSATDAILLSAHQRFKCHQRARNKIMETIGANVLVANSDALPSDSHTCLFGAPFIAKFSAGCDTARAAALLRPKPLGGGTGRRGNFGNNSGSFDSQNTLPRRPVFSTGRGGGNTGQYYNQRQQSQPARRYNTGQANNPGNNYNSGFSSGNNSSGNRFAPATNQFPPAPTNFSNHSQH